ncbi:hypothetical protein GE09DRAFT_454837 [Coniochaeta sp. 2T2.1]|nr:hypothetical protein GE09DRAFT_454837 [Coniochaeta sp. 2T2.1]
MRTSFIAVALSALSFAVAQNQNFTIDPNTVEPGTRANWCKAELNTCNTLCSNSPTDNKCSVIDLTYNCTCANNSSPGLQYYTQTIDSFVCQRAYEDCIAAHPGDAKGQGACKTDIQDNCGTLDPTKFVPGSDDTSSSSSSSSTPTGTPTPSSSPSPSASGDAVTTSSSQAGAPTAVAYIANGAAVVAAGLFAALL